MKKILGLIILSTFLLACKKNTISPTSPQNEEIKHYTVFAQTTDASITLANNEHYSYYPKSNNRKSRLFIFLPGTFGKPLHYKLIAKQAAIEGYYSIGLSYENSATVESYCTNENNDCDAKVRLEMLTGTDATSVVSISRANSIENRIIKLLQYLDTQQPSENWKQFLTNANDIDWSKIVVAGHSQGSGHSAYIGKVRSVFRVGIFAGGGLLRSDGTSVNWASQIGLTASSKYFGFNNTGDNLALWTEAESNWRNNFGMLGIATSVDNNNLPYNNSQILTTSIIVPPAQGSLAPPHGSVVQDAVTPKDSNNEPIFAKVWKYMCFPD